MNLVQIAEIISAIAVVVGIVFAIIQVRNFRVSKERESALELLHSFQTLEFSKALHIVSNLPIGLSKADIEKRIGEEMGLIYALMATWESLGILVQRREVSLTLVSDFFSGPIIVSWRVLGKFVQDQREELNRDTAAEWFQWLAEQMIKLESASPPAPAYIAHKNWQSKK